MPFKLFDDTFLNLGVCTRRKQEGVILGVSKLERH